MSFPIAHSITKKNEYGYINDPDDKGWETFNGISRRYYSAWEGWGLIDSLKKYPEFPKNLQKDEKLKELERNFFKKEFWDKNNIDAIDKISDKLSIKFYDMCVCLGSSRASVFLQKAIGYQKGNILTDGKVGPLTIALLKECDISLTIKILILLEGGYRLNYIDTNATYRKYLKGHIERAFR